MVAEDGAVRKQVRDERPHKTQMLRGTHFFY